MSVASPAPTSPMIATAAIGLNKIFRMYRFYKISMYTTFICAIYICEYLITKKHGIFSTA